MARLKADGTPQAKGASSTGTEKAPKPLATATPARATDERTDRRRWRLHDDHGTQIWKYMHSDEEAAAWPQSTADKFHLGLPLDELPVQSPAKTPLDAVNNGLAFFEQLQLPPGNWACEYGGPMFLLPGLVITWYVTETPIPHEYRVEIKNYLFARQSKEDGGWGLHIEGESSVFGTAMNYTVCRLLGADAEEPRMVKARACLHSLGGAINGPHWAKFWLSVLGCFEWEGVNPVPPELWLLPDWVPIAPWRWWIHMRQVFLPMSYIYSRKYTHPPNDLTQSLRNELFTHPYTSINFATIRNNISPRDNYHPKSPLLNLVNTFLVNVWNPYLRTNSLARRAEAWAMELIRMEDANTSYACLAPVNAPLNTLACYIHDGTDSTSFRKHIERLPEYLWMKDEGMLANGTNGVQTWDTSLAIQAVVDAGLATEPRWRWTLRKALEFLDDQQIRADCVDQAKCYRQQRKGAWAFSTKDQGYTVSDTTSEALKAVLSLQTIPDAPFPKLVSDDRIHDAVDVLLTMQNASSGGFSSYEPQRGSPTLLEQFNAAEVFGRIMVEYDYPECTTAVVTALQAFRACDPSYRAADIARVVESAVAYIRAAQRREGSWYGSWGVCFTYATMFALTALASVGETYDGSARVRRACTFLFDHQMADGGWGESYKGCEQAVWVDHPDGSQVVMTAWAVIALLEAKCPDLDRVERGVRILMKRQQNKGEWLQEGIEGVFNKSCMISYPNYKFTFPIKALGMFARATGNKVVEY